MPGGARRPKALDAEQTLIERAMQYPELRGEMPDWWPVEIVAGEWGCPPDAVLGKPSYWFRRTLVRLQAQAFVAQEQRGKQGG